MASKIAACGTRSGYNRHRRNGEPACDECKTANRLHVQSFMSENRERWREINAKARKRYRSRPEVLEAKRASARAYVKTDRGREVSSAALHRRRARRYGNGFERYTKTQVIERFGTDCHLCGEPIDMNVSGRPGMPGWQRGFNIDHVIPIAQGGPDAIENVRPAHALCNCRKNGRP